jgi:P22 coat protein - gene protein 5.
MSNNFTAFMPSFYAGLNKVQSEQTDLIDAVYMNATLDKAVIGQTITYPIAPVATLQNTSYAGLPTASDSTAGSGTLSLTDSSSFVFAYNGEEIQQLQLGGIYSNYYADQIAQGARALRKKVSDSIVTKAVNGACRAIGTYGTNPFVTAGDLSAFANCNKVLNDNGSPDSDRHMILNTSHVAGIQGKVSNLFKANEAGTDRLLRTGVIGTVEGFAIGMDTQLASRSTFGTAAAAHNTASITAGATSFDMTCTYGTAPVANDTFYFATDDQTRAYVVKSYSGSTVTVNQPGIMSDTTAATTMTFNSTAYKPSLFLTRDAITLIARQPLLPYSGPQGQLLDLTVLPDPRTGLNYQLAMWQNGRQMVIEMALVWGVGVSNPQNLGLLVG